MSIAVSTACDTVLRGYEKKDRLTCPDSSDLPTDEVEAKIEEVKTKVREAKEQHPDKVVWAVKGGSMWLVPTYRPIEEWRPVAIRELPEMRWSWHQ